MNALTRLVIRLRFRGWVLVRVPVDEALPNLEDEGPKAAYGVIESVEGEEFTTRPMTSEEWEEFYQGGEGIYAPYTVYNVGNQGYSIYHPAKRRYYEYYRNWDDPRRHARLIRALLEAGLPVIDADSLV